MRNDSIEQAVRRQPFNPECPGCGHHLHLTVGDALDGKKVNCPNCGATIELAPKGAEEATWKLKRADRELDKLRRMFR